MKKFVATLIIAILIPTSAHAVMASATMTASMKVWKVLTISASAMTLPTILNTNNSAIDSGMGSQFTGGVAGTNSNINISNGCASGACSTLPVNLTFSSPITMQNGSNNFSLTLSIVSGGNTAVQNLVGGALVYRIKGVTDTTTKAAADYQGTSVFNIDYN